jgi:hypothetical protein
MWACKWRKNDLTHRLRHPPPHLVRVTSLRQLFERASIKYVRTFLRRQHPHPHICLHHLNARLPLTPSTYHEESPLWHNSQLNVALWLCRIKSNVFAKRKLTYGDVDDRVISNTEKHQNSPKPANDIQSSRFLFKFRSSNHGNFKMSCLTFLIT